MTNITVNRRTPSIVVRPSAGGVLLPTSASVTIQNQGSIAAATNSLADLQDLVVQDPVDNAVVTYDADENKYVVKKLSLNGGTF